MPSEIKFWSCNRLPDFWIKFDQNKASRRRIWRGFRARALSELQGRACARLRGPLLPAPDQRKARRPQTTPGIGGSHGGIMAGRKP